MGHLNKHKLGWIETSLHHDISCSKVKFFQPGPNAMEIALGMEIPAPIGVAMREAHVTADKLFSLKLPNLV